MTDTVFLLQLFSTIAMVGLIWFVQVVHYPLMERVGGAEFCHYEQDHQRRTTLVVAPLMLAEAGTAWLLLWTRPSDVPIALCLVGLLLLAVIWLSTYRLISGKYPSTGSFRWGTAPTRSVDWYDPTGCAPWHGRRAELLSAGWR